VLCGQDRHLWIWIYLWVSTIHAKSVDMDMDMDRKFHIHGNRGDRWLVAREGLYVYVSVAYR